MLWLLAIIFTAAILRFTGLNWDQGLYLHPDERLYINASNLSWPQSIRQFFSPQSPLNPHMFYYGAFPLYLYVGITKMLALFIGNQFPITITSRTISAFFSVLTVGGVYVAASLLVKPISALIAAMFTAFSVGLIQYAHFNTTESLLSFFGIALVFVSTHLTQAHTNKRLYTTSALAGLITGLSFATKITGLSYGIIPATAVILRFIQKNHTSFLNRLREAFFATLVIIISTVFFGIAGSPYNLIDAASFLKEQSYMQGVTYGIWKPPFVIIYEHTTPYLYQMQHIFPWIFSPSSFLALIGLGLLVWRITKQPANALWITWPVAYFLVTGAWYAKFSRYMVILLPFFGFWAAYAFECARTWKKGKPFAYGLFGLVLAIHTIYGTAYTVSIYGTKNTRIEASEWISRYLPSGSTIAFEHWDDRLPLSLQGILPDRYRYQELKVYEPDTPIKMSMLARQLAASDIVVLSSRRVYASILANAKTYPLTSRMYRRLFDGSLGFTVAKSFSRYTSLAGLLLNDDSADETFQSYDHPPVFIFAKSRLLVPHE